MPSPNIGTISSNLASVAGVSATDVWAVGTYNTVNYISQTLIEHWDGTNWSIVPSPNDGTSYNIFQDVTAASASDVWAIGYYYYNPGPDNSYQALIEHWDGRSWYIVPSPPSEIGHLLHSVAARTANDVWAVGDGPGGTLTEHFTGTCP